MDLPSAVPLLSWPLVMAVEVGVAAAVGRGHSTIYNPVRRRVYNPVYRSVFTAVFVSRFARPISALSACFLPTCLFDLSLGSLCLEVVANLDPTPSLRDPHSGRDQFGFRAFRISLK